MMAAPKHNFKLTLKEAEGKPGQVYMPLQVQSAPIPQPSPGQLLLHPTHVALNHRDVFLRQKLYPSPSFTTPMLADGCCTVLPHSAHPSGSGPQPGDRVLLNPGSGWISHPLGPESPTGYAILGGTKTNPLGTATTLLAIDAVETVPCPPHLSSAEAAALPLTGLTAWRAFVTKSGAAFEGANVLVTGIGGGVACAAVQFAVAHGARVWVSSSSAKKLEFAKAKLGVQGGINYREQAWEKSLRSQLPKDRPFLDAVVDGAGGEVVSKVLRLLKQGGTFVTYGMTVGPVLPVPMGAVMLNIDVRGSTMGSRNEFEDMVRFVAEHKIHPVVSRCVRAGLADMAAWETLFDEMKTGGQMGKLVFEVDDEATEKWAAAQAGQNKL